MGKLVIAARTCGVVRCGSRACCRHCNCLVRLATGLGWWEPWIGLLALCTGKRGTLRAESIGAAPIFRINRVFRKRLLML